MKRTLFTDGWEFSRDQGPTWIPVDLPHDWLIEDTRDLYATGDGWYRRSWEFGDEGYRALRFEGVYMDATVFLDGTPVADHPNGYTTFDVDLSAAAPGPHEVRVRVRHQSPNSRWYSGAGIYRNVWLVTAGPIRLEADGVYAVARTQGTEGVLGVHTEVVGGPAVVRHTLRAPGGAVAALAEGPSGDGELRLVVPQVRPWNLDDPSLYTLSTEVLVDGRVVDEAHQTLGFRTIAVHPETGLTVNGRPTKVHGVCLHHDLGCLGAAVNKAALRRQFVLLKEMGVNALRSAHNAPAVEFMDLADELGLLVVTELYDMWEKPKTEFDFARFFADWAERDVASWVRRDRNHPSLLMWSIGNEIYDCHAGPRGEELTRWLAELVGRHDPGANGLVTLGSNYMPWEGAQKCADIVKMAGYNYGEKYYHEHHARHPDWVIYGSETSSIVQSRGIYHFPASQSVLADDDQQCSSLGNSATSWGAKSIEACLAADTDAPFSLGQFLWSGFDYLGEPTPYHTKNSYFGQLDTAGFKKDSFYAYQSAWTDYRTAPMVHLLPYWDFNVGQGIDVVAWSNAPVVELFFNGLSQGVGRRWNLAYKPGVLEAVAYDDQGREVARDTVSSFGDAARLVLTPDKTTFQADGADLVFVEISSVDDRGVPVANANHRVEVEVTGAGRLVGLDNGDSTDYDQYKGTSRRLFSGKLLAVVAATNHPGPVVVRVASPGLETASLVLTGEPSAPVTTACRTENRRTPFPPEVPVRKIELVAPLGTQVTPQLRRLTVRARLHPAGATYPDVEWRVTDAAGIDATNARIEAHGTSATVTALGDGPFRVRCSTKNGGPATVLYSQLEFEAQGLGPAYLDPYSFLSAGLYTRSQGEVSNGNERGVATARAGETWVCFDRVDFGPFGSDEVTLPLFALDSEAFALEIWEGFPSDPGSRVVAEVTYQKPSVWNTYQAETYRLKTRLKGVTSVCFVVRRKVHLKGFSFTRFERAFQWLGARDCDHLYGDRYTLVDDAVEAIGNNVSFEYQGLDFGQRGARRLVVCGRSSLERNTLHLRFEGASTSNQLAEFVGSADYVERTFDLEPVYGPQKFTLVFLPGSQFDLRGLRFE